MKMKKFGVRWKTVGGLFLMLVTAAYAVPICSADMVWDLKNDFSTTTNPNGAWSYGVYQDDSQTNYGVWPPSYFWAHGSLPNLSFYGNVGDYNMSCSDICYNPGSGDAYYGDGYHLWLRPGEVAEWAALYGGVYDPAIRWTAPSDMTVSINALFTGRCDLASSDVHILLNGDMHDGANWISDPTFVGTHLIDGVIDGNYGCTDLSISPTGTSNSVPYNDTISVHAGDTIDFVTGFGFDHGNSQDMVGISAKITQVPEPATFLLLLFAGSAGAMARLRRGARQE
jgi:hypothetical protein